MAEYYLATKDAEVLSGLKTLSTNLALGRSGVGTYSHGMAYVEYYGLYGPPSAYGAMNQCSITCIMSLALALKCGLQTKEIDDAVRLGTGFLRWYVDKGTIPYGDHPPAYKHDNNGRNSQAAVLFDLVGDKASAKYFVRQTLASYKLREVGHTGHFFATQWGALGAARGGSAAAKSFIHNMRWHTELERRPEGSYGLELGSNILGIPDYVWGTYNRLKDTIPALRPYGQGVKEHFPVIENFIERVGKGGKKNEKTLRAIEEAYEFMKKTSQPKDLKSIRPYVDAFDQELENNPYVDAFGVGLKRDEE